jgi:hypothetical protein
MMKIVKEQMDARKDPKMALGQGVKSLRFSVNAEN